MASRIRTLKFEGLIKRAMTSDAINSLHILARFNGEVDFLSCVAIEIVVLDFRYFHSLIREGPGVMLQ